ncbi:RrF2 family transcriptional regulator [Peribacillus kribbensis]|uniref:RrF2 family transcriptional regulator n=1 Tax=Peribacillus kribbensis TaxID=356658 RepID=UPI0004217F8D|nr:Rrf2 family transcriptional regulator [Peribacillus kribbensis]
MNSEYTIAVHSLLYLAYLPDHMASSEEIARNVCTNPARIRKVMSCLRKHGMVNTREGVGGGYILNGLPAEISLGRIYHSVSYGTLKPNWCSGDPLETCPVSSHTQEVMDEILSEAEKHYEEYLTTISLQNVLEKINRCL